MDDSLRVDVTSLPGGDRGPMIDTVRLWQLGNPCRCALAGLDSAGLPVGRGKARQRRVSHLCHAPRGPARAGRRDPQRRRQPRATPDGRPATNWNHPSAVRTGRQERNPQADRLPILDNRDLAHLGFDDNESKQGTLRSRAVKTRYWLRKMESLGAVALEWKGEDVRVLEPWPRDGAGDGILTPPNTVSADA